MTSSSLATWAELPNPFLSFLSVLRSHHQQYIIYPMSKAPNRTFSHSVVLHIRSLVGLVVIPKDGTRTRPEKDVSNNFTNSSSSIRRLAKLSSPSYNRATRKKCYHSFLVFSSALFMLPAPTARRNRDGTWTMRGLRTWLAHVFRLRGRTDEVSKQRYLWLFQFLSDECSLGNQAN